MDRRRSTPDEPEHSTSAAGVDVALGMISGTAGAAAGLATSNPLIAAAAAAFVQNVSQRALDRFRGWTEARREERVSAVLGEAARIANLKPDVLLERLSERGDLEPLLISTLRAAQDSGDLRKLIALARCLAAGVTATDATETSLEHVLVLALRDLEDPHISVLALFVHGVIDAGEIQQPANVLNTNQILQVFAGTELVMPVILATLERHGLVRNLGRSSFVSDRIHPFDTYEITPLGRTVVERLEEVGAVVDG